MNETKNSNVSKAQAIALVTYLTFNTDYHFNFDVSDDRCDVSIFAHTGAELLSLESELRPFMVDGCAMSTKELTESECWVINIEYPCIWSFAY